MYVVIATTPAAGTCSKSTIGTPGQCVKVVQSQQEKH